MANNNFPGSKKKTVSPRNMSTNQGGYAPGNQGSSLGGPKMLLLADKNQQMLDFAQGIFKRFDRILMEEINFTFFFLLLGCGKAHV